MAAAPVVRGSPASRWRRRGLTALFVAIVAVQVLLPLAGLVARWHDGDGHGYYRYSWHMYSTLDRYRGN